MEYSKIMKVTPKELFDAFELSIIEDIHQATNKKVHKIQTGTQYSKKGKHDTIHVKVESFVPGKEYKANISNSKEIVKMAYVVEDLNDGTCNVTYTEDYFDIKNEENKKGRISSFRFKQAALKQFKTIEKYILSHRVDKEEQNK
ncbi:MAG: DUF3284 domain-containing protein [Erysipelotrichaceae bacterium]|uniref:DUF3284 domain-containing protein n=1 Tax=Floccifex sp. TaxID=2815810 RepID=UPI002A747CE6|nr:DUF3284 domain-containing protein [Floccifex sp.]MDD7282138.1 DUF3284 domain-containing protein [Erysipelotrichaceae bacterium]MDY2959031.1 DUF3284 domain-containing protein [Floccifex sp.]